MTPLVAGLSLGLALSVAGSQPDTIRATFLDWVNERLPSSGGVVVRYEDSQSGEEVQVVGIQASGSWFVAASSECMGRDPTGRGFRGSANVGGATPYEPEWGVTAYGLIDVVPTSILFLFAEQPERIRQLERGADGGWLVAYEIPSPIKRPLGHVELGPDGRPVRTWLEDPADRRETAYEYSPDSPPGFGVAVGVGAGARLIPTDVRSVGPDETFTPDRVERMALDLNLQQQRRASAANAGYEKAADGTWVRQGTPRTSPYTSGTGRWRWPLLITGFLLVAIGGFELWRRHR